MPKSSAVGMRAAFDDGKVDGFPWRGPRSFVLALGIRAVRSRDLTRPSLDLPPLPGFDNLVRARPV
jgi:hypothetical protein